MRGIDFVECYDWSRVEWPVKCGTIMWGLCLQNVKYCLITH